METIDFAVCSDCLMAIANSDFSGMDDETATQVHEGLATLQENDKGYLVCDGEELGFSWRKCACCNGLAGDRFKVIMIIDNK